MKEAYVHCDGELLWADSIDVLAFVEIDGISCRGGRVALDLPGGTSLGLGCTAVPPPRRLGLKSPVAFAYPLTSET